LAELDQRFQLAQEPGSLGLSCGDAGVSLAGVPLLRATANGFEPRPANEIGVLMKGAFGRDVDPADCLPRLGVIAEALNRGDLGRAMVAALHLRLPELDWEGAARIARADQALTKYDPDELRDERGRWTTDGASGSEGLEPQPNTLKPTLVSDREAPNGFTDRVCSAARIQCQITTLNDKSRPSYFSQCYEAEDACNFALAVSLLVPNKPIAVIFPDKTVVDINNGVAKVTHVGGTRLSHPLG
jgi:hypothetical protein